MSPRVLARPARATNAALLGIALTLSVALGWAAGQLAAVGIGLVAVALYVLALAALARDVPVLSVLGSGLLLLATVPLATTPAVAVVRAAGEGTPLALVASTLVPLSLVGVVAGTVAFVTGGFDPWARREAVVVLTYAATAFAGAATLLLLVNLGLLALGLGTAGAVLADVGALLAAVEGRNAATRVGSLSLLAGLWLLLAAWIAGLPLYRRGWRLLRAAIEAGATNRDADEGDGEPPGEAGGTSDRDPGEVHGRPGNDGGSSRGRPLVTRFRVVVAAVPPVVAGQLALVAGLFLPRGAGLSGALPADVRPVGVALDLVAGAGWLRAVALWLVVAGVLARVAHAAADWAIHFPWKRYRRRVTRAAVPAALVVAAVVGGPLLVGFLRATPALHYVYVLPGGRVPYLSPEGLAVVPVGGPPGVRRASGAFLPLLDGVVATLGSVAPVLVALTVPAVVGASLLIFLGFVAGPILRAVSSVPVVVGWLAFLATLSVALLDAPVAVVLACGVATLLLWDLQATARGLSAQLEPGARTTRGEFVHAGGIAAVLGAGAVTALAGHRAVGALGPLAGRPAWQLVVALACLVAATGLGLTYLTLRSD